MDDNEIKKLRKKFLKILRNNNGRWSWQLRNGLEYKMEVSRKKILHIAHMLHDDGMIMVKGMEIPLEEIYEITSKGYDFLNPVKKIWTFFAYYVSPVIVMALTILQIIELI